MSKILFLSSLASSIETADKIIRESGQQESITACLVPIESTAEMAQQSVNNGVQVIVARGVQAGIIKSETTIPLVDVVITAQELGMTILEIKSELPKKEPTIAVVGLRQMFCDTSHFSELFGVDFKAYFVDTVDELYEQVDLAVSEGHCDIVIGGRLVCRYAQQHRIPCKLLPGGEESIQIAFQNAKRIVFAMEQQEKAAAEHRSLFDYSFNGFLTIDKNGVIVNSNRIAQITFNKTAAEFNGLFVTDIFPSLQNEDFLFKVLEKGNEIFGEKHYSNGATFIINLAPIVAGNSIDGAILSFRKIQQDQQNGTKPKIKPVQLRNQALTFDDLESIYKGSAYRFFNLVKTASSVSVPVMIFAAKGTSAESIAVQIHNNSSFNKGPFISFNCSSCDPNSNVVDLLFGAKDPLGLVHAAKGGTLFLDEVDALPPSAQYKLYRLLSDELSSESSNEELRVIASCTPESNLHNSIDFRFDLYSMLTTLTITLPVLRNHPFEIEQCTDLFIRRYSECYSKYVSLTKEARKILSEQPWSGNYLELNRFCEKLVITTNTHLVSSDTVINLLRESQLLTFDNELFAKPTLSDEAETISELIREYNGNREKIAKALGISTTTLWRRLKKYNLL